MDHFSARRSMDVQRQRMGARWSALSVAVASALAAALAPAAASGVAPAGSQSSPAVAAPVEPRSGSEQSPTKLAAVTVTANRQEGAQNIQQVPMAITALDPETLNKLGLTSLSDYARLAPSVDVQEEGPGVNSINIRGLVTRGLSVSEIEDRSLVALYIDDTPITMKSGNPDLHVLDLQDVEILRGPQGTLYGAGSMAGTIRQVTVKPDLKQFSGNVETTGSYTGSKGGGNGSVRATLNIPLVSDKAALRINAYSAHDSGYIKNVTTGKDNANNTDQLRLALRVVPTDRLTVDASFIYAYQYGGLNDAWQITPATLNNINTATQANGKAPVSALRNLGPYSFASIGPERTRDRISIFNVTADYDFGFAHLISSSSAVRHNNFYLQSADYTVNDFVFGAQGPVNQADYTVKNRVRDYTEELRLVSSDPGPFKWTAGLYYESSFRNWWEDEPVAGFDERVAQKFGYPGYNSQTTDLAFQPNDLFSGTQNTHDVQLAEFAEGTYTFADKLDLTLGVRHYHWAQDYNVDFGGLFGILSGPPYGPGPVIPETSQSRSSANGFTPRFAAAWHFNDKLMLFAEAAKGFRYGGNNQPVPNFCGVSASPTFGPDSLWSYSVGEKGTFLDDRLQFNTTAYYIRWNNTQAFNVIAGCGYYFTENAGRVDSKGLEIETKAKLAPHLTVGFNGSYTDAALAEASPILNAPSGARVPYSPKYIANFSANYDWAVGAGTLNFNGSWSFRGGAPTLFDPTNPAYRIIPKSNNLAAAITYELGRWEYSLYGDNLTNGTKIVDYDRYPYLVNSQEPGDRVYLARPRTVGIRLRVDF